MKNLVGVILAAGKGSRMGLLPTDLPKTVLPILDEPVLYHQLRTMVGLGIQKAYIVVGHLGFKVVQEIERLPNLGIEIIYVGQPETLGIAHCVGTLEPYLDTPFLLFLGDIFFDAPEMGRMVVEFEERKADAVLGVIEETSVEALRKNFCVMTDAEGWARRVIEKPRHPQSTLKGVGVYLFQPAFFDAVRRTPRTALRDEYEITDSIQIFIEDGYRVWPCRCVERDLNITYPEDLLDVNLYVLQRRGLPYVIAADARIGEGVTIERSVIGAGAWIGEGSTICDSLVFAGAHVPAGAKLRRAIVIRDEIYQA